MGTRKKEGGHREISGCERGPTFVPPERAGVNAYVEADDKARLADDRRRSGVCEASSASESSPTPPGQRQGGGRPLLQTFVQHTDSYPLSCFCFLCIYS